MDGEIGMKKMRTTTAARGSNTSGRMAGKYSQASNSTVEVDYSAGLEHGRDWRKSELVDATPERLRDAAHSCWYRYYRSTRKLKASSWKLILQRGTDYIDGFMKGAEMKTSVCPVPLRKTAAAIVCSGQDEEALYKVLKQLNELPLTEIIVVLHNASDELYAVARNCKKTLIAHLPETIDSDVGRALGAKLTTADTLLFVDGEYKVSAVSLARFLWECDSRLDVALNDISANTGLFNERDGAQHIYEFLNASLSRPDLKNNSLSTLPFALSRHAFNTIGAPKLAVPAKAHAAAILAGLNIGVGGAAKWRGYANNRIIADRWSRAAGDHVEAWREALTERGSRLKFADLMRNRKVLGDRKP